ncbi:MAG: ribosomal-processing cysteine protease Prp [Clostridia bacterium]|nr:ribosomal-processing cysteine protease Prp [Clostridia bacterium]
MIKIKFFEKSNTILGLECSGHSGYAEFGSDIICSAVSSIVGSCLVGLKKVLNLAVLHEQDNKNAYFKLMLKSDFQNQNAQVLLKTTKFSLQEVAKDYQKYIAIEIIGG